MEHGASPPVRPACINGDGTGMRADPATTTACPAFCVMTSNGLLAVEPGAPVTRPG